MPNSAHFRDLNGSTDEQARRRAAESHDDFGSNDFDLPIEEWAAGCDFLGRGRAVAGGAALYDVTDVHAASGNAETFFDHTGEQLTRSPAKGNPAQVFLFTRPFPYEHELCAGVSIPENDLRSVFGKLATRATCELCAQGIEGSRRVGRSLAGFS